MVRRIKAERWEAFLDEYRPTAEKDSDYVDSYVAHLVLTRPHFARIFRVRRERYERLARRIGRGDGRAYKASADAAWLWRQYGRKGKNRWRVK